MRKKITLLSLMLFSIIGVFAQSGAHLYFDGSDDYVALPQNYSTSGSITELTVCGWAKVNPGGGGWSIVDFDRSEYYNVEIGWTNQSTNVVNFATADFNGTIHDMAGTTNVRDGNWHHIAAVFDGTNKYIYVDGVLDATATNPHGGMALGTGNTRYGIIGDGSEATTFNGSRNSIYYDGFLDELNIWHDIKSISEINNIMNNGISNPSSQTDLFAYYKYDSGSGQTLVDSSSNSYDGQLGATTGSESSDPTWYNYGTYMTNYLGSFDGSSDYANIQNTNDINLSNHTDRTVEAWFKADDVSKSTKQVIYEEGGSGNGLNIYIQSNRLYLGGWSESQGWGGNYFNSLAISSNIWHHVAIVLSGGSTFSAYLDGSIVGSTNSASTLNAHSGDISIGRNGDTQFHTGDDGSDGEYFEGSIDELRIWNEDRSLAELRNEMHRGLLNPLSESNLVCYLKFEQNGGNLIKDYSSKNNDGTLVDASSISWGTSTAPIPYYTINNGNMDNNALWASGQLRPTHTWSRIKTEHQIFLNSSKEVEELHIKSGAELQVNEGGELTVNGILTNNAGVNGLQIKSSSSGSGSLIHNTASISATVESYHTPNSWHLSAPPVSGEYANVFYQMYLTEWNEVDSTWTFIAPGSYPIYSGSGFGVWVTNNYNAAYQGTLMTGDFTPSGLSYNNGAGEGHGWNLLGNPYASAINWDASWTSNNITSTIYVLNSLSGNYETWNGYAGTKGNGIIPVGQGFWVKATGSSPSLTMPNNKRIHSNQDFYKGETQEEGVMLTISGENGSDKTSRNWQGWQNDRLTKIAQEITNHLLALTH